MSQQNRTKLNEIVSIIMEIDPGAVTDDLSPERLEQWDSLNHLNLCVALGQEFGVEMTTDEMASIRSIGDIVRWLGARGVVCT